LPIDYAYFDTSALIKRYVDGLGRREVLELLRKNRCVISAVLPVEVRNALRCRVSDRTLDPKRVPTILKRFAAHVASAKLFGDRTAAQTFTFVSADAHQTRVAEALGLNTQFVGS
jgi:predicted nucleic acid-binding protein